MQRGLGVDGFGMTPEEAGKLFPRDPPLGVYATLEIYARYIKARNEHEANVLEPQIVEEVHGEEGRRGP